MVLITEKDMEPQQQASAATAEQLQKHLLNPQQPKKKTTTADSPEQHMMNLSNISNKRLKETTTHIMAAELMTHAAKRHQN